MLVRSGMVCQTRTRLADVHFQSVVQISEKLYTSKPQTY